MNTAHTSLPGSAAAPFGDHLRQWRQRRRMSQLDLSAESDISTRHLSFVETGRSLPSLEMVLRLFEPLRQQVHATADPTLAALLNELQQYTVPAAPDDVTLDGELLGVVVPFRVRTAMGLMSFISTTTVFGSPVDVTLQELAVESFFPADEATALALRALG